MSTGTTPPDLTKVQNQCSLTNYIELIRVDALCERVPAQFEMVRWKNPSETLQHLFAMMNVFRNQYDLYEITPKDMAAHIFKLKSVSFDDLSERKAVYFAIKNTITSRSTIKLTSTLYNIWVQIGGSFEYPGTSEKLSMRFPIAMPSRIQIY
jgi:hypothetical protein